MEISFIPHCHGTHTECISHITADDFFADQVLAGTLTPAVIVSVTPRAVAGTPEADSPFAEPSDRVICGSELEAKLRPYADEQLRALIVRTLPNGQEKQSAIYDSTNVPPYFSLDAIRHIGERNVVHLLSDLPSIDRIIDGGRLLNHRLFWRVPKGSTEAHPDSARSRTISEMIFVNDDLPDGFYLLDLQLPAFRSDAAPSRPVVYALEQL